MVRRRNPKYPVAGLGPAIHVWLQPKAVPAEDVDARDKLGQGDFLGFRSPTAAGVPISRAGLSALMFGGRDTREKRSVSQTGKTALRVKSRQNRMQDVGCPQAIYRRRFGRPRFVATGPVELFPHRAGFSQAPAIAAVIQSNSAVSAAMEIRTSMRMPPG